MITIIPFDEPKNRRNCNCNNSLFYVRRRTMPMPKMLIDNSQSAKFTGSKFKIVRLSVIHEDFVNRPTGFVSLEPKPRKIPF